MNDNGFIEEALRLVQKGVTVTFPVTGQSMLPFIIGGKESVILHRPGLIDVGDVVLAWVDGNRYVVHRIIKLDYVASACCKTVVLVAPHKKILISNI